MKIVCMRQCFWRDKRWNPGDKTTLKKGEEVPRHFEIDGETTKKKKLKSKEKEEKDKKIKLKPVKEKTEPKPKDEKKS